MTTITVYDLNSSRSDRILWLMEELGLPYRLEQFARTATGAAPPALADIHPLGRAPIVRDGGTVLAESGAIVEYLVTRYGDGRLAVGAADPAFARYLYWFHYAEGSLMPQLLRELMLDRMLAPGETNPVAERVRDGTRAHLRFVDESLASTAYFAGDRFTAADVMMTFPFTTLQLWKPIDLAPYVALSAYLARIAARPAYVAAMSRCGPAWRPAR